MDKKLFGTLPTGEEVYTYTLKNDAASLTVMNRGATVVNFYVYGTDIIGGFDTLDGYLADDSHQGATIGRVANRVANATFTMDGAVYMLPDNDNGTCLHGGCGFDYRIWEVTEVSDDRITFTYLSPDGDEGFPSELKASVTYILDGTTLIIDYTAIPYGKTPIALTNHSYFNLDGFGGTIKDHVAVIYAKNYTEVDESLIPNGEHPTVFDTPFDFTTPHTIGERIGGDFVGYDHNFILFPETYADFIGKKLGLIAEVCGKALKMSVYTDQPGVQFYIGNFLGHGETPDFKGGVKQVQHGAFCLETQTEPNCINLGEGFYDVGDVYKHTAVYKIERI